MNRPNRSLEDAVADVVTRYIAANSNSRQRHEAARQWLPGGNTRTVLHYDPFPVAMQKGKDATLIDIDGHSYIDILGEYSAGLYGHSNPVIGRAIVEALAAGVTFGAPNLYEAPLAEVFCSRFPSVERVRFCNSGTEANLLALQMARAVTGRRKVIVLEGAYHGAVFFYQRGLSAMNLDIPVEMVRLNDVERLQQSARTASDDLAAIIMEPLMGNGGCLPASNEFLQTARDLADETGALLIFDEVMTSRLGYGGLQSVVGVIPDVTTFGKYLGGGLSFGALGGKATLMERFDPGRNGGLPHSGTFNNNTLMMAAALAGLREVLTEDALDQLNARGDRLRAGLESAAQKAGVPFCATGRGSMMGLHFQSERPSHPGEAREYADWRKLIHLELLLRGIYTARRGFATVMLPLTDAEVDRCTEAFEETLREYRSLAETVLN